MFFKRFLSLVALAAVANAAQTSRDALNERLDQFHGFYASRVAVIAEAGSTTHDAVQNVTNEVQQLLKMVVNELNFMDEKAQNMDEKYKNLDAHWRKAQSDNKELEGKNKNLEASMKKLAKENESCLKREDSQKVTIGNLLDTLGETQQKLKLQKEKNSQLQGQVVNVTAENQQLEADLEDNKNSLVQCEETSKKLEEKRVELQNSNDDMIRIIGSLNETNQHLQDEITQLSDKSAKQTEIIRIKEGELKALKELNEKLDKANKKLEEEGQKIEEENNKCEGQLANVTAENQQLEADLEDNKNTLVQCEVHTQQLEKKIQDLENNKEKEKEVATLKERVANLTKENDELQTRLQETKQKCDERAAENAKLLDLVRKLEEKILDFKGEVDQHLETILLKNGRIKELEQKLKDCEDKPGGGEEVASLKEQLENAQKTVEHLKEELRFMHIKFELKRGGYRVVNKRYVKFYRERYTWAQASQMCQMHHSHLIIAKDRDTQYYIKDRRTAMWIGATDAGHEGKWTWVDGTPVVDGNWNRNEPNNGDGKYPENCAAANYRSSSSRWYYGKWSDKRCDYKNSFACEIPNYVAKDDDDDDDDDHRHHHF